MEAVTLETLFSTIICRITEARPSGRAFSIDKKCFKEKYIMSEPQ